MDLRCDGVTSEQLGDAIRMKSDLELNRRNRLKLDPLRLLVLERIDDGLVGVSNGNDLDGAVDQVGHSGTVGSGNAESGVLLQLELGEGNAVDCVD
ncbi:hypothetical protein PG990_007960 [Apiospora arundinis]